MSDKTIITLKDIENNYSDAFNALPNIYRNNNLFKYCLYDDKITCKVSLSHPKESNIYGIWTLEYYLGNASLCKDGSTSNMWWFGKSSPIE